MKKILLGLFLFQMIFLVGCRKEEYSISVEQDKVQPKELIEIGARGEVVDELGQPLPNLVLKLGNITDRTDIGGRFDMVTIVDKKEGGTLIVESPNHFEGVAHSNFRKGGRGYLKVTMMAKGEPKTIDPMIDNDILTDEGININIPAGAIRSQNGDIYNGEVKLYDRLLSDNSNLGAIMPGAMTGKGEDGELKALASLGMVAIAFEDANGDSLQIDKSNGVELSIPIAVDQISSAPDEVILWHYDLEQENWYAAGMCLREGEYYKCRVYGSGYFCSALPSPAICLSGQFFNSDSTYSRYQKVVVENLTNNFVYWGYTDSLGMFCGAVPQAVPFNIQLVDHCDKVIYEDQIGPYSTDTDLGMIYTEEELTEYVFQLMGNLYHCTTNDLITGHIGVRYPGHLRVFPVENSIIDTVVPFICAAFPEIEIQGYSMADRQTTIPYIHDTPEDLNLGNVLTCESISDFMELSIGETNYFTAPTMFYNKPNTNNDPWLVLEGVTPNRSVKIEIGDYNGLGTYTANTFFSFTEETETFISYDASSPDITVLITEVTEDFISGNIQGSVRNIAGDFSSINGSFKVRRRP